MAFVSGLSGRIAGLSGFAMLGLAFALGAVGGFFGHAPWRFLPLFALVMPVLVWMLDGIAQQYASRRQKIWRGFWLGSCFGLGYFLFGLYWIGHAFLITPLAVLAPFGVFALAASLALFTGLALAASISVWPSGWLRFLSLAFFWAIAEWARGFVATGFPWNLPAQSWLVSLPLAQNFAWVGLYGATFITIAAAASFAAWSESNRAKAMMPPLLAAFVFVLLWAGGSWRLAGAPEITAETRAEIIIIQPNIAQRDKWNPRLRDQIIKKYLAMSAQAFSAADENSRIQKIGTQKIMVWPEAALAVDIENAPNLRAALADIIPDNGFMLTGLLRFDRQNRRAFNAIYLITATGALQQHYDKIHLVPFGEYLPAQSFLESLGLRQLTGRRGGFTAGENRPLLQHQGSPPVAPLICYEIIFAREIPGTAARPDWLVNVTNDGWYGLSSGPHQHFDFARLRAIEQGLPVVRAANTGISAIIDGYGRIIAQQPLGSEGIIRASLPPALPPTFYAAWRDWVFVMMLVLTAILILHRNIYQ